MKDLHALAAPYALGALDQEDRESFEDHLERCETCRTETAGFELTTARLAQAVARRPPPAARARLLAAVSDTPQERPVVTELARRRGLRKALPRMVVAATFLLGAVAAGGYAFEHGEARDSRVATESMTSVLAAPDASTTAQALKRGGNVRLVSSATRDVAVIAANDLPRLTNDRVYQVWMLTGETARSQGTFATEGSMIMKGLGKTDHVAVTIEPRGGSKSPTTLPVVSLRI